MSLDLSTLEGAIAQLEDALDLYDSQLVQDNPRLKRHMRAAAIQAFEFTYELSFKMLKRYLELTSANPAEIEELPFNGFIREAFRQGLLLSDLPVWQDYRTSRGTTSHAYDEDKAQEVFNCAPGFRKEARYLLAQLQERNESLD